MLLVAVEELVLQPTHQMELVKGPKNRIILKSYAETLQFTFANWP